MDKKGFIQIPFLVWIIASIITAGTGYSAIEYYKISKLIEEAKQLTNEEKYEDAIKKLESIQNKWFIKNIGIKKQIIIDEIGDNKKFFLGTEEFNKGNWQEAVNIFSEIPKQSFYYQKAQTKIEETKRKSVEEEFSEEKIARTEAEKKAKEETSKRIIEEAKRAQEELEKEIAEKKLSEKEAEEKRMNADNDNDGLTYREELNLGTSDLDLDSDGDGIPDGEDLNPAGGGRNIAQHFEWSYQGDSWSWDYSIHEDWYEYYKNKPRESHGVEYVTEDDPFIQNIAQTLEDTAEKEGYHLSSFIVSFVQGLSYIDDYYTSFDEYPKYPVETFVEKNGDCEDTSYLFASIIDATNLGSALIQFHDHMGVGINTVHAQSGYYYPINEEWYYYYETTGEGWEIGELPSDYLYENAKIIRVWDNSVYYSYPQYVKPCYSSPDFVGYYSNGDNYYSDSQCRNLAYCLPYEEYYVRPDNLSFYWDSSCSQLIVSGCSKSTNYPGYFYDGIYYYSDSYCINKAKICVASSIYSDRYWDGSNNYWDSNCTQKVLSWCSKSSIHPEYFINSFDYEYYLDSECSIPILGTATPPVY